jgi:hypothetical protein
MAATVGALTDTQDATWAIHKHVDQVTGVDMDDRIREFRPNDH